MLWGLKLLRRKVCTKIFGSTFCCTVEHVQLKNVTVDVMKVSDNYSWCKMCSRMHLEEKIQKFFWEEAQPPAQTTSQLEMGYPLPDPTSVSAFGAFIQVPKALKPPPPNHISGYGPASMRHFIAFNIC